MAATGVVDLRSHWEGVYLQKGEGQLSWHQDDPALSLALVQRFCPRGGKAIDVGGGTSVLAGKLAASGHAEVTVLDISGAALRRAQERSGFVAGQINWIVADVCGPAWPVTGPFDVWHDRAVFHFLTDAEDRRLYAERARNAVGAGGHLVLATFALDGPDKCSGLPVQRYDAAGLAEVFTPVGFALIESQREVHATPWESAQPFVYVVLRLQEGAPVRD